MSRKEKAATADGAKLPAMIISKQKNGELGPLVQAKLRSPKVVVVPASLNRLTAVDANMRQPRECQ